MKTREQQRSEILKECRKLSRLRAETMMIRQRNYGIDDTDEFIGIKGLQDIILKAMEIKPATYESHEEMAKLSRRGPARKVRWTYTEYSVEQRGIADKVIKRMADQGYIELKCYDTAKNIWKFRMLNK